MKKLLVLIGPTATGKTDLALSIAQKLDGELVSCDSRQVYKGLDIGTGKLPGTEVLFEKKDGYWIVEGIPIWLYDVADADFQFDVWQYVRLARAKIQQISDSEKLPIIVGGTGLYLKALLEGFSEMDIAVDLDLREELLSLEKDELQRKLEELDPDLFQSLNEAERNNSRRLVRRIEKASNKNGGEGSVENKGIEKDFTVLKIGLTTDRDLLYRRIDERVVRRVSAGMIDEAKRLNYEGLSFERMRQLGLEYRLLADLLEGRISSEAEFITQLQFKIHQYAKRQLTWFRADDDIFWFDILGEKFNAEVEEKIVNWYNS